MLPSSLVFASFLLLVFLVENRSILLAKVVPFLKHHSLSPISSREGNRSRGSDCRRGPTAPSSPRSDQGRRGRPRRESWCGRAGHPRGQLHALIRESGFENPDEAMKDSLSATSTATFFPHVWTDGSESCPEATYPDFG
jgi:hypothetical protein